MKVRKEESIFDAFQYSEGVEPKTFPDWLSSAFKGGAAYIDKIDGQTYIKDGAGRFLVSPGDWIVKSKKGDMTPFSDEYFRSVFESVEE
jgi:hypothetical protein